MSKSRRHRTLEPAAEPLLHERLLDGDARFLFWGAGPSDDFTIHSRAILDRSLGMLELLESVRKHPGAIVIIGPTSPVSIAMILACVLGGHPFAVAPGSPHLRPSVVSGALASMERRMPISAVLTNRSDAVAWPASVWSVGDTWRLHVRNETPTHGLELLDHDGLCLLQSSSGTTGRPATIAITTSNLASNLRAISSRLDLGIADRIVTWLPMYHDMGLVGMLLAAFHVGCDVALADPSVFLRLPLRWLEVVESFGGSFSAAPSFAFDLLSRRLIASRNARHFDLRSWSKVVSGSEQIDTESYRTFFGNELLSGLSSRAAMCAYGLAQATVAVTITELGAGLRSVRPSTLSDPEFRLSDKEIAILGRPVTGCDLRIRNSTSPTPLGVGEVEIKGQLMSPSCRLDDEGWYSTGDLGVLTDHGELAIVGRQSETIVVRGVSVSPLAVEAAACSVVGVRRGHIAAVSRRSSWGTDGIAVVVEVEHSTMAERNECGRAIRRCVAKELGVSVDIVKFVPPGSLERTTSGKLRRASAYAFV